MYRSSYDRASSIMGMPRSTTDETARSDIERLERKLARQHLITQTLLALLLEKSVIVEDEFLRLFDEMDQLDGVRDGALADDKRPVPCKACGKNNARDKRICMWCGQDIEVQDIILRP